MPNWKKVIVSGSSAHLHHVTMSGDISGSSVSTASFGYIRANGGISSSGQVDINAPFAQLRLSDDGMNDYLRIGQSGTVGYIKTSDGDNNFKFRRGDDNTDLLEIFFEDERIHVSGSGGLDVTGHITASGNISSSASSTGSFGQIEVGGGTFTSASLAEGGVAIKDENTTILSSAQSINFTGGAVSASVDGTQTNVTIEALATEVFEDGVAIGTSIFDIELVQDSDNSTILASN